MSLPLPLRERSFPMTGASTEDENAGKVIIRYRSFPLILFCTEDKKYRKSDLKISWFSHDSIYH